MTPGMGEAFARVEDRLTTVNQEARSFGLRLPCMDLTLREPWFFVESANLQEATFRFGWDGMEANG